jgi:hypothetical protein
MSDRLLRRLIFLVMALSYPWIAPECGLTARGDDRATTAHESAVLDRIFANWKARHDRVHSLHFTMDVRVILRKGYPDNSNGTRFKQDQEIDQFGIQVWIENDDRFCLVNTPSFRVPQTTPTDTKRVVSRTVIVGKTSATYFASPDDTAAALAPYGLVQRVSDPGRDVVLAPLFFAFRRQYPSLSWLREQSHLVDENAPIDDSRCVEFQRTVQRMTIQQQEACWVSPVRDDVVVHWTFGNTVDGSVKYTKDKRWGWIPSEWSVEGKGEGTVDYKVTDYAINPKIDPAVFSLGFPAGTPVLEQLNAADPPRFGYYVVQKDGAKRSISWEEFDRLRGGTAPPKKKTPARPSTK